MFRGELTERQRLVLKFIQVHLMKYGYPPTIREIANNLGVKWTRGIERHLDALQRKGYIRRAPDTSRGIQLVAPTAEKPAEARLTFASKGIEVPLVGRIAAGKPMLAIENIEDRFVLDSGMVKGDGNFLLRVKGMSMKNAGILDGDLVLVRSQTTAESGDIVVALLNDEEATVKRLKRRGSTVTLEPDNPEYEPVPFDEVSTKIIGKVIGVLRFLEKPIAVRSAG
ncbi:MAG: transcriptional repressor LexA [Bacteroidota bacterium]